MANIYNRINKINRRLEELPQGTLTYKKINGKAQPYIQRTIDGKSVSYYVKTSERDKILLEFDERNSLLEEKKRLQAYADSLKNILADNPFLDRQAGIGWQSFSDIIDMGMLYVDKTHFINEWWESSAQISLITRPRRFGKTLMMSTVRNFFDPELSGYEERFSNLKVWRDEKYRNLYGTIPVISISFGDIKSSSFDESMYSFKSDIYEAYSAHEYLKNSELLSDEIKAEFCDRYKSLLSMNGSVRQDDICFLSKCLNIHHHKKPIILLDEYDTPLIEAYTYGYYNEMIEYYRGFSNKTFKKNEYYYRAIITGINKVSKNALYSDMNNIKVYSVLNSGFENCFGFTEDEVKDILKCQDIDLMNEVKAHYDGFIIGRARDIYNPWSICNFIDSGEFKAYWVNTSSNSIIGELVKAYPNDQKSDIEELIKGNTVCKTVDENLALNYMKGDEESFWALMVAIGYVKAEKCKENKANKFDTAEKYYLSSTNRETTYMLEKQILAMFPKKISAQNDFAKALVDENWEKANYILNDILMTCISCFDAADSGGGRSPAENFYHGLVLGMIVALREKYDISSNRESGLGRYDVCMIPNDHQNKAFIIEFKIRNQSLEQSLDDTADNALSQIESKKYDTALIERGISSASIIKLAIAFDRKTALIKENNSSC